MIVLMLLISVASLLRRRLPSHFSLAQPGLTNTNTSLNFSPLSGKTIMLSPARYLIAKQVAIGLKTDAGHRHFRHHHI